jgi:hypothetical protein
MQARGETEVLNGSNGGGGEEDNGVQWCGRETARGACGVWNGNTTGRVALVGAGLLFMLWS